MIIKLKDPAILNTFLDGVFCVYKPHKVSHEFLRNSLLKALCKDFNLLEQRPQKERIVIEENENQKEYITKKIINYADSPSVVGLRYQPKDFQMEVINYTGFYSSGIHLIGIGKKGCSRTHLLKQAKMINQYKIEGILGIATDDFTDTGKIIEKSTYKHLTRNRMEMILSKIQSTQQAILIRQMNFSEEEKYERLSKGLVKPNNKIKTPIIYSVKCEEFKLPNFILNVHCLQENEQFLKELVNAVGLDLRSNACTSSIKCVQSGPFSIENAISHRNWNLESILRNISELENLVKEVIDKSKEDFIRNKALTDKYHVQNKEQTSSN